MPTRLDGYQDTSSIRATGTSIWSVGYVPKMLLTTAAILIVVAAVNYTLDPYGAFDPVVNHQPMERALFAVNTRLAKAHIVADFRPQAIVLGTSRAEVGLSPEHPGWNHARVYNLGLPQSNMRETLEYLEHAIAAGALEQAVIGLDFLQFNPLLPPRPDFDECRLRNPGSLWSSLRAEVCDIPVLLLSRRAFVQSIAMLGSNQPDIVYLRDGSRNDDAKEAELARAGSQHAGFLNSEYRYYHDTDLLRGFVDSDARSATATGRQLEELLRLSHRHGLDLRLFISPTHARQQELLHMMDLWEGFVRWKRYLLEVTHKAAADSGASPYPLWDFAAYSAYSQEPLPPIDDSESRMQWYWESSHYTRALGNIVLDQVLAGKATELGRRITRENFDEWIQSIEEKRPLYRLTAARELSMMRRHLQSPEAQPDVQALENHRARDIGHR
jgi:hypothetical protein